MVDPEPEPEPEPDCWVDYSYYPGPYVLYWDDPNSNPLEDLRAFARDVAAAYGHSTHQIIEGIKRVTAAMDIPEPPTQDLPKQLPKPPKRNHGPRPRTTFDLRGRRRY